MAVYVVAKVTSCFSTSEDVVSSLLTGASEPVCEVVLWLDSTVVEVLEEAVGLLCVAVLDVVVLWVGLLADDVFEELFEGLL